MPILTNNSTFLIKPHSSLNVNDQVLHPYKITDKIIVLYILNVIGIAIWKPWCTYSSVCVCVRARACCQSYVHSVF